MTPWAMFDSMVEGCVTQWSCGQFNIFIYDKQEIWQVWHNVTAIDINVHLLLLMECLPEEYKNRIV